jgi:hypothetical protein
MYPGGSLNRDHCLSRRERFGNNLWEGWLGSTAKNNFDRRNLTSLKSVWDDRKWIGSGLR